MPISRRLAIALGLGAAVTPTTRVFAQSAFPVTVKHALGEAVIEALPQRIVTLGWSSADAAIALGTIPVGIPTFRSDGFDGDIVPWVEEAVAAVGGNLPETFSDTDGAPIEKIAALEPDLILAVYSGITADEYAALSQIAPVVAYPDKPWTASWQEVILMSGAAMGKADEAATLVAELEAFIVAEAHKHPEVPGTSFVTFIDYQNAAAIHGANDARAKMLVNAGMVYPPKPAEAGADEGFWYALSYENFDRIPADILIGYFNAPDLADAFFSRPVIAAAPQVRKGAVVRMTDRIHNMSVISSSALSIRWGMPRYFDLIAEAARNAKA